MVGRLLRTMYGTRDAAAAWNDFVENKMGLAGYRPGEANPCLFRAIEDGGHADTANKEDSGLVHRDDFMFVGEEEELLRLEAELGK